jgi:hypothetical protein
VVGGLVVADVEAIGLRGIVSALVFGVTARDPVTYLLALLSFLGVGLAAVRSPHAAQRAWNITALRYE